MSDDNKIIQLHGKAGNKPLPLPEQSMVERPLATDRAEFYEGLSALGIEYNFSTNGFYRRSEGSKIRQKLTPEELVLLIFHDHLISVGDNRLSKETITDYLRLWALSEERKILDAVRARLAPVDRDRGAKAVDYMVDTLCSAGHDYAKTAIRQFVWQVRNKLFKGKVPSTIIMPVLQGKQGCGKTTAITKLISHLEPLTLTWSFDQIADSREWFALERYYIAYIEELAGARGKKQIDNLKSVITGKSKNPRKMRENFNPLIDNNICFIGDTNHGVAEIINDSTGARRFWEIRCKPKMNFDAMLSIDLIGIWGCVHEDDSCPWRADPGLEERERLQDEKLTKPSPIKLWVLEREYKPAGKGQGAVYPCDELYADYKQFCRERQLCSVDMNAWSQHLSKQLDWPKSDRLKGKRVRYLVVPCQNKA